MVRVPILVLSLMSAVITVGCGQSQDDVRTSVTKSGKKASTDLEALTKLADSGDAKAQLNLGTKYAKGEGVEKNLTTAFGLYLKSAESGNAEAMVLVADAYTNGHGVAKDYDKYSLWIRKGAEAGNADAQEKYSHRFGWTDRKTGIFGADGKGQENADQYIEWLEKSSNQGNKKAQYSLGMTYLLGVYEDWAKGTGKMLIESNMEKALQLLKVSSDANYWQAQWALAVLYQSGYGKIKADKEESKKYWKILAEQSDPEVQNSIGNRYHADTKQYYKDGKNKYQGKDLDFSGTNKIAFEWFLKSADKENKNAQYSLGTMYRDGIGVYKDEVISIEYFKKSAGQGNFRSMQELAYAYVNGNGVVKDYTEAHKWFLKAADEDDSFKWSGVHKVRNALGALYEFGWGVEKDIVLAYAWYNISASGGFEKAKQNLERLEKTIKPEDMREAQTISREWKPLKQLVRLDAKQSGDPVVSDQKGSNGKSMKRVSAGTGFYISADGKVLTNNHVIEGCGEIRVPIESNITGKVVVADPANDLALIKLDVTGKTNVQFPSSDELKQGEEVFVFGFPLDGFLPSSGNITPGIISALAGPNNNSSLVQITAPVQPGNSGGALLNKKGKVVGVVVGKANAIKIANVTGDIPQNINFAISPRTVKSFLDSNRVEYQKKGDMFSLAQDSLSIADEARKSSLKIECWR